MRVYRLPYGRVYHDLDHSPDPGDRPFARCNVNYVWNDNWVVAQLIDVPKKDVCRRCFPSPGKRITYVDLLESRLKEALDGWEASERAWIDEYHRDFVQTHALSRVAKIREELEL